jgi:dihydroorotate dehydrogenase electron transfer subunit
MPASEKGRFVVHLENRKQVSPSCHILVIERPDSFPDARPGQFVSIRACESTAPLLRRPFSIMDLTARSLSLLVKVVGPGSAALAALDEGDTVDLIGPLGGTEFPAPREGNALLVAGGTGLAPLVFAARTWRRERRSHDVCLLYGASTKDELLDGVIERDFSECSFATIDGSAGHHGDVVQLCENLMEKGRMSGATLYSCGPRPMVRALVERLGRRFPEHLTSLESVMACGVGACRGCTVPVRAGGKIVFKAVCSDGTVFGANDVAWEEWEE